MTADEPSDRSEALVVEWIEKEIGPVRAIARQGRWRPAWYVEAEEDGRIVELYVRGARGARFPPMPLAYEAKVIEVFAEGGVKVAPIRGYIEAVPALVMERLPGRPNIATAESDEARERLRAQLADQMRIMHEIDPAKLEAIGAPNPSDPREVTLTNYRLVEQLYLEGDRLPAPDIEFVRVWVERNAPPCVEGPAVITVDAGQFVFEGDELTGLVDFELACIGDRHLDIAALRVRDRVEEIGDLESFYDVYHERGGIELDRDRIAFHWVTFAIIVPMQIAHDMAHAGDSPNQHEYTGWHARAISDCMQDIARIGGVELEPYQLPEPTPERAGFLVDSLATAVAAMPATDEYSEYRRFDIGLGLKYLGDYVRLRAAMEQEYLDDIEALTGRRPRDAWDGDVQLEEFVRTADPSLDPALLQLLWRRNERVNQILRRHYLRRRAGMESV